MIWRSIPTTTRADPELDLGADLNRLQVTPGAENPGLPGKHRKPNH